LAEQTTNAEDEPKNLPVHQCQCPIRQQSKEESNWQLHISGRSGYEKDIKVSMETMQLLTIQFA
jgi:hypothetical protein